MEYGGFSVNNSTADPRPRAFANNRLSDEENELYERALQEADQGKYGGTMSEARRMPLQNPPQPQRPPGPDWRMWLQRLLNGMGVR